MRIPGWLPRILGDDAANKPHVRRTVQETAKVVGEWLFSAGAVVGLSPVLTAIALTVRLTSPGPALFVSERVGRGGKPFRCYKFRTMRVASSVVVSPDAKTIVEDHDTRLTPIGALLRIGLDELPQLFNVLRGEMALIGPRPDPPWMVPRYTEAIRPRLSVRPGITGLTQVLNGRERPTPEMYNIDLWYIRHRSPLLDLRIFAYTFLYLAGHRRVGEGVAGKMKAAGEWNPEQFEPATAAVRGDDAKVIPAGADDSIDSVMRLSGA